MATVLNIIQYNVCAGLEGKHDKELKQTVSTDQNRSYVRCESLTSSLFRVPTSASLTTCVDHNKLENS